MRGLYQAFPIWDAVRTELHWIHYCALLRLDSAAARLWYMNEAAAQHWSSRAPERQIGTLYYERLLASRDRAAVEREADARIAEQDASPREFVRDPVLLEFLGLPDAGLVLENDIEQALMNQLQAFLLELGKGFAFVARQQRISTDSRDYYIDLVFYNYLLKCVVIFDLKRGEQNITLSTFGRWRNFAYRLICTAYSITSMCMAKIAIRSGWMHCVTVKQKSRSSGAWPVWRWAWLATIDPFAGASRNFVSMLAWGTEFTTPSLIEPSSC